MISSLSFVLLVRLILGVLTVVTVSPASCFQTCNQPLPKSTPSRAFAITSPSPGMHRRKNRPPVPLVARVSSPSERNVSASKDDEKMVTPPSSVPPRPIFSKMVEAVGSTTSILVAGTFYAFFCYRRDALIVSFFVGAISNGIVSKLLKRVLNEKRPAGLDVSTMDIAPSDNGMPSSHAMSLGFICTFTALQVPWTALPLLLYSTVSLIYRVQTKLHSPDQILVGAVVGSLNGAIWWSCSLGHNPYGISINDWVTSHVLNAQGLLPWPMLSAPALVGAAVVGSVERRLAKFFKTSGSSDIGGVAEVKQD